jgi:hypothetical protein
VTTGARSIAETGVLLHVFGDACAHSREVAYVTGYRTETRNCGGETLDEQVPIWSHREVCFPTGIGHGATVLTRGCGGSEPDAIGRHPELYKLYVENLYQVLCALRPNAPREQGGFALEALLTFAEHDLRALDSPFLCWGRYDTVEEARHLSMFLGDRLSDEQMGVVLQPEFHEASEPFSDKYWLTGYPDAVLDAVIRLH